MTLAQRGVRPADEHREVTAFPPGARADRVDCQPLDGEISGLKVKDPRGGRLERAQERLPRVAKFALLGEGSQCYRFLSEIAQDGDL